MLLLFYPPAEAHTAQCYILAECTQLHWPLGTARVFSVHTIVVNAEKKRVDLYVICTERCVPLSWTATGPLILCCVVQISSSSLQ